MKIKTVAIGSISQDPANLRKHGERNIDAIVASLRKFGQQHPIVIDSKGIILSGNGRYMAAVKLGWSDIKVVESSLTGSAATAYAIADNRTAELAEWDTTALAETLRALQSEEFDTAAAGYSDVEIDALVEGLGSELLGADKEIVEDKGSGKTCHEYILSFGDTKIPITFQEYEEMETRLVQYNSGSGTNFGFCSDLLGLKSVQI
jgi:ParB-like chromosome segregation protein Spo0J